MTDHLSILEDLIIIDWREFAACRDIDSDLFFPAGETGPAAARVAGAKRICQGCDVIDECLAYAIETNQVAGVWGGYTEDERRPIRRKWLSERRRTRAS